MGDFEFMAGVLKRLIDAKESQGICLTSDEAIESTCRSLMAILSGVAESEAASGDQDASAFIEQLGRIMPHLFADSEG